MKRITAVLLLALGLFASVAFAQTATVNSLSNVSNRAGTYYATSTFTLATTPTDIFVLKGSATKTVYVESLKMSCTQGSVGGPATVAIVKRTNANTTHVSEVSVTASQADSTDSAATASVITYTSAGANTAQVGSGVDVTRQYLSLLSTVASVPQGHTVLEREWGRFMDKYITLRGVAQSLAVNLGGATLTGAACSVAVTWIER